MRPKRAALVASWMGVLVLSSTGFAQLDHVALHPATFIQSDQSTARVTKAPDQVLGVEILSDTQGLDFGPYVKILISSLRASWNEVLAQDAVSSPDLKGSTTIRFTIRPDGSVSTMHLSQGGNVQFDRAAWQSFKQSSPFQPLPKAFTGPELELQVHFNAPRKTAGNT